MEKVLKGVQLYCYSSLDTKFQLFLSLTGLKYHEYLSVERTLEYYVSGLGACGVEHKQLLSNLSLYVECEDFIIRIISSQSF